MLYILYVYKQFTMVDQVVKKPFNEHHRRVGT